MVQTINNYELTSAHQTAGINSIGSDINAYNSYGMTPTQVALQAGAIDELKHILAQPGVDAGKPSRSNFQSSGFIRIFESSSYISAAERDAREQRTMPNDQAAQLSINEQARIAQEMRGMLAESIGGKMTLIVDGASKVGEVTQSQLGAQTALSAANKASRLQM
jgi:hypothetical protein